MKLITELIAFIPFFGWFWLHLGKEAVSNNLAMKDTLNLDGSQPVWMLPYFRQRYQTCIEIDTKGNTVEVPLPDPMLTNKLHIAL